MREKALVVVGPTATGKTDLAIKLAKKFGGELVSCDSRQVYKGLDEVSGKVPEGVVERHDGWWKVDGIKIWMLDMVEVDQRYSVSDYIDGVSRVIQDIRRRGKLPIIVGGTGYYLKGLLEGFQTVGIEVNEELRHELDGLTVDELQKWLKQLSSTRYERMNSSDRANKRRLIRAIEVIDQESSGQKASVTPLLQGADILEVGLDGPMEVLRQRIKKRLESRLKKGMVVEVERLLAKGLNGERMDGLGLECRYITKMLLSQIDYPTMVNQLELKIGQYAKRQKTWFKKDKKIKWFDITGKNLTEKVEKLVEDWYNQGDGEKS